MLLKSRESSFVSKKGDVIALVSRPKSLLRLLLEQIRGVRRIFRLPHRPDRVQSPSTSYASERWFDAVTSATIIFVGLVMLFIPMWWLEGVDDGYVQLGIITGFVFLFSVLLFGATTSSTRGFEVLAATAAYAAVLAVFLQGNNSSSPASALTTNGTASRT